MFDPGSLYASLETFGRLAFAIVLGGVVGLEREQQRKPAGLRTHMLVSLGAATFMLLGLELAGDLHAPGLDLLRLDPMRLIQGIIGGIGFLGAGAIIRERGSVAGLTTAGSLWFVGALGVTAGAGRYLLGIYAAVLGLIVLQVVGRLGRRPRDEPSA